MLDMHCLSGTASLVGTVATGAAINTIPANDGQSAAGVPIAPGATLVMWGGGTGVIADTLNRIRLISQDQIDPLNGEDVLLGAGSLMGNYVADTNLPFRSGNRTIYEADNTAGAVSYAFLLDMYPGGNVTNSCRWKRGSVTIPQATVQLAAANTWYNTAFAPAAALPNGTYALEGASVTALATATSWAVVRFQHADFGQFQPGFPVIDPFMSTNVIANTGRHPILHQHGNQFDYLSETMGMPCVPCFRVTSAGTGLVIWMYSPIVSAGATTCNLYLTKLD